MPQYTLADLDARVLDRLDGNAGLYPQAQRYAEINDSLRVVNLFCPFVMGTVYVPGFTVTRQQFYPVPPGIIFPLRAYFNGRQLSRLSMRAVSMRFRTWTTDTASIGSPVREWIPAGLGMFAIHPIDNTGGQALSINGVMEPAPLVNPTDSITIEDQFIEMIEDLSVSVLQIKESSAIFSAASVLYQKFQREIKEEMRWNTFRFGRYYLLDQPVKAEPKAA